MIVNKTFKYRIYPNKATVVRLIQWMLALKWLWNLANEQRRNGYGRPKGERIYPSVFGQGVELTELRKIAPSINDVPRHVCVSILDRLGKAWDRCFAKIAKQPRWKKKKEDVSLTEFDHRYFSVKNNKLKFPKLPPIPIVISRPLEGKPKSCTIKRNGDQWFACIVCEIDIRTPESRIESPIGIDRGVRNLIADSNGRLVTNPKFLDKFLKKLARAQRAVCRKVKGSKNQQKAYDRVNKIHHTIRRQREHFLHVESTHYAKSHGIVVIEDLNVQGMVRSRLARHIQNSGWSKFAEYLAYKLQWSGGNLYEVPAHYTSQTCAACNHVDKVSRCGDQFKCTSCGNEDHADLNAAKIVLARWSPASQPVEGSSQRAPQRSRKLKSKKLDFDRLSDWSEK